MQHLGQRLVVVLQQGQIVGMKAPNVIFGRRISHVEEVPRAGQTTVQGQLQMAMKEMGIGLLED